MEQAAFEASRVVWAKFRTKLFEILPEEAVSGPSECNDCRRRQRNVFIP